MINEQYRMDIITNNMANADTCGYKQEGVTNQSFDSLLAVKIHDESEYYADRSIGSVSLGVKMGEVYTDFSQGSIRETGNTYDLAISGDGFFAMRVTDKNGNDSIKYTRAGEFQVTADGYIVDADGNHLQGSNGDVQVSTDTAEVVINQFGEIYEDGELTGQITLTDFEDYNYLSKFGNTMYTAVDGATQKDATGEIEQGWTEQSTVNIVNEMVNLITITRAYETNQKMITTVDKMLDQAANSVGKVS
jgi:flagellar basal-body rod protein FlgG